MDYTIKITWTLGNINYYELRDATPVLLEYELNRLKERPEVIELSYTDNEGEHVVMTRNKYSRQFG